MLAQCQMIWMLLSISVGWTISPYSTHPIRDKKQLLTNVIVAAIHVSIVSTFELHKGMYTHTSLSLPLLVLVECYGEQKRQGRLRLHVARGQSRGQNASSDTYLRQLFSLKNNCFGRVVLCCFVFLLYCVALPFFLSI